jgi:DNA-binding transcriptional MerR regulator
VSGTSTPHERPPGQAWSTTLRTSASRTITLFTVTVITGNVYGVVSDAVEVSADPLVEEWSVDELAQRTSLPVRTIREYQTIGLLPSPRRVGRVGRYGPSHLRRLQLIARLQQRGYSLAGIGDLLTAWRSGAAISDVLGLDADELVQIDEPGASVNLEQLTTLLPALVRDRLDDLLASGVIDRCGPDRYCAPSPSLLQLTVDVVAAGLPADDVLALLIAVRTAADTAADAVIEAFSRLPGDSDSRGVHAIVTRGRTLIGHGVGRLTLHRLGRKVGAPDHATSAEVAERLRAAPPPRHRVEADLAIRGD